MKVALIKRLTIPRLDLCGANCCLTSATWFHIPLNSVYAWTDSTIVLSWLCSNPRRFKTYVGNRVSYIVELISPERWSHVESANILLIVPHEACTPPNSSTMSYGGRVQAGSIKIPLIGLSNPYHPLLSQRTKKDNSPYSQCQTWFLAHWMSVTTPCSRDSSEWLHRFLDSPRIASVASRECTCSSYLSQH